MTKTKDRTKGGEMPIAEAVAWIGWHPAKIRAACEELPAGGTASRWVDYQRQAARAVAGGGRLKHEPAGNTPASG
jgi:hypothetical protein